MKKLQTQGKALSKEEQKQISGGTRGHYLVSGLCADLTPFNVCESPFLSCNAAINWALAHECAGHGGVEAINFTCGSC